jgi:Tat protein translocase TatB subunit
MFNVGGGEVIVIMLIALIVLGPQRLPDAARQVGKALGDLRRLSTGFQNEMRSALKDADDPDRVAARRNVLAKELPRTPEDAEVAMPVDDEASSAPTRTTPLRAAPPTATKKAAPGKAAAKTSAAKRAAPKKAATKASGKNGTAVKKKASGATAKKPAAKAAPKAGARRSSS